jgi:aspartyl-tRNA(Asn)/glutamyl-tRNA(Gln) amidotransferase subunit A
MSDLTAMTLAEARDAIRAKKISSRELTGAFVSAIEKARPLNAFITEAGNQALAMADAADKRIASGQMAAPRARAPLPRRRCWAISFLLTNPPSPRICGMRAR